jgi:hypothetical protein
MGEKRKDEEAFLKVLKVSHLKETIKSRFMYFQNCGQINSQNSPKAMSNKGYLILFIPRAVFQRSTPS